MDPVRLCLELAYPTVVRLFPMIGAVDATGPSSGQGTERVAEICLGTPVEVARTGERFERPRHPYTEVLMLAISLPDPHRRQSCDRIVLEGEIHSARDAPPGCPFRVRCRYAEAGCREGIPSRGGEAPPQWAGLALKVQGASLLKPVAGEAHLSACSMQDAALCNALGEHRAYTTR